MDATSTMDLGRESEDQPEADPRKREKISLQDIVVMICLSLTSISGMYTSEIPGSLQHALMKYFDISACHYSLLVSMTFLPASILTPIGGYMVDSSFGPKRTTYLFLAITVIGCILFAVGAQVSSYAVMVTGRFLYGFGQGIVVGPVIFYYILFWFKGTYSSLMFSLSDNLSTIGTMLTYAFSNKLMESISHHHPNKQALSTTITITSSVILIAVMSVIVVTSLKPKHPKMTTVAIRGKLRDCLKFPLAFWILVLTYSTMTNAIFVFEQFSQDMLINEFGITVNEANMAITVLNITKIVLAFPEGFLIDYIGRNLVFFIASLSLTILAHITLIFKVNPNVCSFILGLSGSLTCAALSPMYGYILNESNYGLGIGLTSSLLYIAAAIYSLVAGKIIDAYGYIWVQIYFIITVALGLIALISMIFLDKKTTVLLNMSPSQRKNYEQSK